MEHAFAEPPAPCLNGIRTRLPLPGIPMMRRSALFLCLICFPIACGASLQQELERYNHLKLSPEAQVTEATDNGELAAFSDYTFACSRQDDHLPDETPAAREAFERFVTEFEAHPTPTVEDKRRRLDLLKRAIAAHSWRAEYLDAVWGVWDNRSMPKEAQPFMGRLAKLADEGNPLAFHALLTWTNGMYEDMPRRVRWLKTGIEGGNPQILSNIGYNLGTHSIALRPMAVRMLECAAAQGEASAYNGIGRIAWQEGRWVDAYRAWERGANLGCEDCAGQFTGMDMLAPLGEEASRSVSDTLAILRAHYDDQFLFQISHLMSLHDTAPEVMQLHLSDAQIIAIIKGRIARYGLP